jgi:hypothetical protein
MAHPATLMPDGGSIAATLLASLFDLTRLLLESLILAALRNPTASQK